MSDELDRLAAAMKNIRPSKASRKSGIKAAMAAFDTEFAREVARETVKETEATPEKKSSPDQGLAVAPRPTGQTTHSATRIERVQTFGRDAMAKLTRIFDIKPQTLMMGGTCMAAILASFVYFQTDEFDTREIFPVDPKIAVAVDSNPDVPLAAPVIEPPIVKTPVGDEVSDVPSESPAVPKTTAAEVGTVEAPAEIIVTKPPVTAPLVTPPEINTATSTDTPSNVVVIERSILKTPASTRERVVPPVQKTVTRRRVKTPARTVERDIPVITKQETRRVKAEDGTFKTVTETVVVQRASAELVTIPAEYETYTETVVVQEASTELVTVPPVYETVRETVMINADGSSRVMTSETLPSPKMAESPSGITSMSGLLSKVGSDEIVVTGSRTTREAAFRSRGASEPAMIVESRDEVTVTGGAGYISDADARSVTPSAPSPAPKIAELSDVKAATRTVERVIPAVTKSVSRRVVKTPASTIERVIPAITKDVTVRVENDDGTFTNVTKTFVIQEASTELITHPPVYETVYETVMVREAYTELVVMNADGSIASRTLKVKPPKPPKPKPMPQSGRLTAGDYDDVLNPELYQVYLDKMLQGPLKDKELPYVDANKRISIRVVDRLGKAVPLADILLKSADGEKMFPLRTGADGMAYLYPDFDGLKSGTKIKISVKGARTVRKKITKKLIKNGGEIVVDLKTNRQPVESLDLLLTIDATGSMGDEMRYLQSELKAIIGRVEEANPGIDIRTGLIVYRDEGDEYIVREIPFTDDLEDFRVKLAAQYAAGGGDTPEAMHMAMQAGLKMNWRDDALKVNLLVADAPPHDQYIADTWETGLISRTRGIHVVPLAASGVDKTAEFLMRSMAQITGGRFLFLTDDSGIGNPHAEPSVDCYVVTRLDGLVTRVLSSLIKGERAEPEAGDVIRSVGNYRSGICAIDSKETNALLQNAAVRDEQ